MTRLLPLRPAGERYLVLASQREAEGQLAAAIEAYGAHATWVETTAAAEGLLGSVDAVLVQPRGEGSALAADWLEWVQQVCRFRAEQVLVVLDDALEPADRGRLIDAGVTAMFPSSSDPRLAVAMLAANVRSRRLRRNEPLDLHLDARGLIVSNGSASVRLSEREFALLAYLVRHRGRVQSRAALLEGVWGDLFGVEERTVDTTLSRLRRRLHSELGLSDAIRTVPQGGYLIDAAVPAASIPGWSIPGSSSPGSAPSEVWLVAAAAPEQRVAVQLCEANGLAWRHVAAPQLETPVGVGLLLADADDAWLASLRGLLERWPDAAVMVVDAGAELDDLRTAIELGVRWVVPQSWSWTDLRGWLACTRRDEGAIPTVEPLELLPDAFAARVWGVHVPLPRRDFEVLEVLHRYAGRPVRREQLHRAVWGGRQASATRSLDAAIGNLRRAFGGHAGELPSIETVVGFGYRLRLQ